MDYKCPLCLNEATAATALLNECLHRFCYECIREVLLRPAQPRCACCKQPFQMGRGRIQNLVLDYTSDQTIEAQLKLKGDDLELKKWQDRCTEGKRLWKEDQAKKSNKGGSSRIPKRQRESERVLTDETEIMDHSIEYVEDCIPAAYHLIADRRVDNMIVASESWIGSNEYDRVLNPMQSSLRMLYRIMGHKFEYEMSAADFSDMVCNQEAASIYTVELALTWSNHLKTYLERVIDSIVTNTIQKRDWLLIQYLSVERIVWHKSLIFPEWINNDAQLPRRFLVVVQRLMVLVSNCIDSLSAKRRPVRASLDRGKLRQFCAVRTVFKLFDIRVLEDVDTFWPHGPPCLSEAVLSRGCCLSEPI